jgi:hypothetical protein
MGDRLHIVRTMRRLVLLAVAVLASGCAAESIEPGDPAADEFDYSVEDEGKSDGTTFNQHNVVSDDFFINADAMTVEDVQAFFERSPYNNRSWLADFSVNGVSAAQLVMDAATEQQVHPLMLIARMQVEASLVSKTVKPSQTRIDKALGCGCPDGSGCSSNFRGFGPQMTCGATILRKWYDGSIDGSGQWRKGVSRKTLDPRTVTPANHATASLYAYTPWVLVGSGGNWLVWNVTRKYVRHAEANALVH